MAVRLERAHAQLFGRSEGLLVMGFGRRTLRGIAMPGDVAEKPQAV